MSDEKRVVWVVESSTQGENVVCRVFATESEAQAYAATAREWRARALASGHACYKGVPNPDGEACYRSYFGPEHRVDLVDEAKAASKEWPFGSDLSSEFFRVTAYPLGMEGCVLYATKDYWGPPRASATAPDELALATVAPLLEAARREGGAA